MKKLLILLAYVLMSQTSYTQIFTKIQYFDKFDDSLKEETIKTLITKTDSTFIIEEKGRQPKEYRILNYAAYNSFGSKDDIVDLTGQNVYGFQDCWCVVKMSDYNEYLNMFDQIVNDNFGSSVDESIKKLEKYWLYIVHRRISKYSFTFEYDGEFLWIQNDLDDDKLGRNVRRIIYMK